MKTKTKFRPKKLFYDEVKGRYYKKKKNGKRIYIKTRGDISKDKLISINIKNTLGYVPRRRNTEKKKKPLLSFSKSIVPTQIISPSSGYAYNSPEVQKILSELGNLKKEIKKEPEPKIKMEPTVEVKSEPVIKEEPVIKKEPEVKEETKSETGEREGKNSPIHILKEDEIERPKKVVIDLSVPKHTDDTEEIINNLPHSDLKRLTDYIKNKEKYSNKDFAKRFPPSYFQKRQINSLRKAIRNTKIFDTLLLEKVLQRSEFIGKGIGKGKRYGDDGLWTDEVEDIIKDKIKVNIPVISTDEIPTLYPKVNEKTKKFGFIMNNGKEHWVSVLLDRNNASLEYYDSLAQNPPKKFFKYIKPLIDSMGDDIYYKIKINRVKDQSDNSGNCGYFAINFLNQRFRNKSFKKATFYDKVVDKSKEGEKMIRQKFKNYI